MENINMINEETARRAKEANSFSDYKPGINAIRSVCKNCTVSFLGVQELHSSHNRSAACLESTLNGPAEPMIIALKGVSGPIFSL